MEATVIKTRQFSARKCQSFAKTAFKKPMVTDHCGPPKEKTVGTGEWEQITQYLHPVVLSSKYRAVHNPGSVALSSQTSPLRGFAFFSCFFFP